MINEKGIYHGGELNLREFYGFQPTVNKGITKLQGYTFAKKFYLQPSDVKLLRPITCDFWNNATNLNDVYEINYRDIVVFFCFNLHWTCMFILLIYFKVFGKVQWTTLQYTRYRGHIWSRRKVYQRTQKLSRKSFISLAFNIRNYNITALKEQHSEKYSFVDANSKQNAVVRNVSETSPVPCR